MLSRSQGGCHREEKSPFTRAIRRLEELTVVQATRSGLVKMIPILTIGAFALILKTIPDAQSPENLCQLLIGGQDLP